MCVCLCFLCSIAYPFFYQIKKNPDSLLKAAADAKPSAGVLLAQEVYNSALLKDDKRILIKSLNVIAGCQYDLRDYRNGIMYAEKALSIAKKYQTDSLSGDSWLYMGMANYGIGNFQRSIEEYKKSAFIFQRTNQLSGLAAAYLNIGISERKLSKYSDAIKYFVSAAQIFETLKKTENLSYAYNSISLCFVELKDYVKALFYSKKALVIREGLDQSQMVAQSLNNIGFAFYKNKQTDSSIYYLNRAVAIYMQDKDSSKLILPLQNLGASWRMKGLITKAENYIVRAQRIAVNYKMGEELARGNSDLAEIYVQQKKYPQALIAINVTIDTAKKLDLKELLLQAYAIKYNIYKQTGDYKNALLYADKKDQLNDAIFTIEKNKAIGETEAKYQTKQKERDIASLRERSKLQQKIVSQQTKYIVVLSIAAVLLATLFVIAYNNFRKKNKANKRIQTLMQDLHHRVKNNLQILSGLFTMQIDNLSDENTKNALRENEARLTSMNLIHNKLYLDNTTTKIEMNDYLTKLLNHIKDSFGGYKQSEINLRIEVSNIMLEADKAVAIGLIANELTTNAFKYAFNGQVHGEIHLALQLVEKSKILLTLGDNGVGLKAENKDKAPSFGLKLVNLMARQLNSTLVVNNNNGVFYQMEISI